MSKKDVSVNAGGSVISISDSNSVALAFGTPELMSELMVANNQKSFGLFYLSIQFHKLIDDR